MAAPAASVAARASALPFCSVSSCSALSLSLSVDACYRQLLTHTHTLPLDLREQNLDQLLLLAVVAPNDALVWSEATGVGPNMHWHVLAALLPVAGQDDRRQGPACSWYKWPWLWPGTAGAHAPCI